MTARTTATFGRPHAQRIERLGRRIFKQCIASDGSLLTPDAAIWTAENLAEAHRRVVDSPARTRGTFAARLDAALDGASDDVRQLLAEICIVHQLPLSQATAKPVSKVRLIEEVLRPIPSLAVTPELEKAFADGMIELNRSGRGRRWTQLGVIIGFAEHFKAQPPRIRRRAGSDPATLRQLVFAAPSDPEPEQRHVLLYLLRPNYFLPVVGARHRTRLRDALAPEYLPVGETDDLDADLHAIDEAVRRHVGGPVDYYLPPWRARWLPDPAAAPSNGHVSRNGRGRGSAARDAAPPAPRRRYLPMVPGTYRLSSSFRPPDRPDHQGLDFAADLGTPIYAPSDGVMAKVGIRDDPNGFGSWLVLDAQAQWGLDFVFGHMPPSSFINPDTGAQWQVNDKVRAGQQLAVVGNEGGSTGPHLHFETWAAPGRFGGQVQDPAQSWIPGAVDPRQAAADQVATPAPAPSLVGSMLVDYSAGVPSADDIAGAGFVGAVRYVSDPRDGWMVGKPLRKAEADDLRSHGLVVVSNFQFGKRDWDGGAEQGARDAERGIQLHREAGGPEDAVIYVSVDADPTEDEWNTKVAPYLRAWQDRLGKERFGVYCNAPCIDRAKRDGLGTYFWQHNWGSAGRVHDDAHLHQFEIDKQRVAGVGVDRNRILKDDFGQWDRSVVAAAVAPDVDRFPLPPGFYWGPLDGPEESWSNLAGTEPQYSTDGLRRWQDKLGLPSTGVFDEVTKAAALRIQRAMGWAPSGNVNEAEWHAVIRDGWGPPVGEHWPPAAALSTKDGYAQAIIGEGVRRNISPRGIKIALSTALVETNMRMYANSKDQASLLLPHDAVGSDGMSVGLFQQQNFAEWKSLECRMDAACSAGTFYEHLERLPYDDDGRSPGSVAQAVQRSAFPDRYDQRFGEASGLFDRLVGTVDAQAAAEPVDADRYPLPPGVYWGPMDGPDDSWSNLAGTEPQYSKDGLRRWQQSVGVPGTGVYDDATKDAATRMQHLFGWTETGIVDGDEWDQVIRKGWSLTQGSPEPTGAPPTEPVITTPTAVTGDTATTSAAPTGSATVADPGAFPLPLGHYWGPQEDPEESWSNREGTEPQSSIDGLRRWQLAVGIPGTGVYDDATKNAAVAMQRAFGWQVSGNVYQGEWSGVIRPGWRLPTTQPQVVTPPAVTPPPVVTPVIVTPPPVVTPPVVTPVQPTPTVTSPDGYPITWVSGPGYNQGHREYVRIYLHTTESQDWITTAEGVAAYQTRQQDGSYHFLIDDTHIINTVATKNTAWGVLSDNGYSVQIAMVGTSGEIEKWSNQNPNREERPKSRVQWLAHDKMLDMVAYTIAVVARDHCIPIERVDIDGVGANRCGVSSHNNYTYGSVKLRGFKDGTHWDVPDTFPYDVVLDAAKAYLAIITDPDAFPLPAGHYWGPLDGPSESWSNMFGGEPQSSKDGLRRWQVAVGIAPSGIYDDATKDAATKMQQAFGWPVTGQVYEGEWNEVIRRGWRLPLPVPAPPARPRSIDPGPPVGASKKVKDATGPGCTDGFGMGATDLGVMTRTPAGRILAVFGDTFRGARAGAGDWRAPVALFSDTTRLDDGITWHEAAGGVPSYAAQLWPYPHDNPVFSTVLPSDVITVGDTIYLHVMVNRGLGNVVWTEIWKSTDDGHTWQHSGAKFDAGLHDGLAQQWTWDLCEDGWVYVLSTGFQRDKPLILRRVQPDQLTDPTAYQGWGKKSRKWGWGNEPAPVLQGSGQDDKFGELCLRRIDGQWVLINFDSSNVGGYDIDVRVFADITGDLNAAHTSTPIRGVGWGQEGDDAVAQLYGPSIVPGSTIDGGFHILLSQWKTEDPGKGWPYRAMQFKIPVTAVAAIQDDGAEQPHRSRGRRPEPPRTRRRGPATAKP